MPLCRGAVWGPGHLFPWPGCELEGEVSFLAEISDEAPILSGAPLHLPAGGHPNQVIMCAGTV